MHHDSTLSADQQEAIRVLIEEHTGALLEQTHTKITEAIAANQETIIATIPERIIEAVNNNQRVIIATAQNASPGKEPKRWLIIMAVIPIVVTSLFGVGLSILGYVIWETQASSQQRIDQTNARLQQSIDQTNARLTTRLSFTEEFYKRRFTAYDKIYNQVVSLKGELAVGNVTGAADALAKLNQYSRAEKLYLSDGIVQEIDDIWMNGINILRYGGATESSRDEIARRVSDLEKHMKKDLWTEPFD